MLCIKEGTIKMNSILKELEKTSEQKRTKLVKTKLYEMTY